MTTFGLIKALLLKYRWDFTSRPYAMRNLGSNPRNSSYRVIEEGAFCYDICTVTDLHVCDPEA